MTLPPTAAVAPPQGTPQRGRALPGWARLAPGLGVCFAIAVVALLFGRAMPLVGAPLFAIAIGVVIANTLRDTIRLSTLKIGDIAKLCLKTGIVVLGASLDLSDIAHTGGNSLLFLAITVTAGLVTALVLGRAMGIDWRIRCLIGMGTTIWRRLGDRGAGAGDPRQGGRDRLRRDRRVFLQHDRGVPVPGSGSPVPPD